eukprot:TRINITY_DN13792_c0_g1_i1.p1 TRINITY_DN13792_c0_g1~~TRINITY_DN13792_c0_g1_i1.p1  ORF type:complete len:293 (+),score=69.88 TRINITY_DN13792_c0_g1_i1:95-973(+)
MAAAPEPAVELPAAALFAINERVFVADPKHNGMMYEAKILKFREQGDPSAGPTKFQYFIHYNNWNTRWDTWVDESAVLKFNEENQQKAEVQAQKVRDGEMKNGGKSRPSRAAKKRKRGDGKDEDNADVSEIFQIPPPLRRKLVEDSSLITQSKQLVPLPRTPTVAEILAEYWEHLTEKEPQVKAALDGLRLLFDEEAGTRLLYRFERVQLRRMLKQNPSAKLSDIYGAEHLLRLFVHMSQNMSQIDFTDGETEAIKTAISGVMRFLAGNVHTFFLSEYEQPPQEYVKETGLQ